MRNSKFAKFAASITAVNRLLWGHAIAIIVYYSCIFARLPFGIGVATQYSLLINQHKLLENVCFNMCKRNLCKLAYNSKYSIQAVMLDNKMEYKSLHSPPQ